MLDENDVIEAVCLYLEERGFEIKQKLDTSQQGIDIIAESPDKTFTYLIEAKGGTSSVQGSNRFGKPYTSSQVFDRVAKGFYTAAELLEKHRKDSSQAIGLAFPDTSHFRKYVGRVKGSIHSLGVKVFWVSEEGAVNEETTEK